MTTLTDMLAMRLAMNFASLARLETADAAHEAFADYCTCVGAESNGAFFYHQGDDAHVVRIEDLTQVEIDDLSYPLTVLSTSSIARTAFGVRDADGVVTPCVSLTQARTLVDESDPEGGKVVVSIINGSWSPVPTD